MNNIQGYFFHLFTSLKLRMDKLLSTKQIQNFHKINELLPKYQLQQFISYKNKDFEYHTIKSNKQITSIIENSKLFDNYCYLKLISLLAKHCNINDVSILMTNILSLPLSDSDIYDLMRGMRNKYQNKKLYKKIHHYGPCPLYLTSSVKKVEMMKANLSNIKLNIVRNAEPRYLDFGCGNCRLTEKYGKALGIKHVNIYGADLENWFDYNNTKRQKLNIQFVEIDENKQYNFDDNFFSLVSCFMVLHHVKNLNFVLRELNRITTMGGYIYVTEHQAVNNSEKMLCDIEHSIYEISYRSHYDYHTKFYSQYYHWLEWHIIFKHYGFEAVDNNVLLYNITEETDPTKKGWMLYRKKSNLSKP